jgi:hypothetical protein
MYRMTRFGFSACLYRIRIGVTNIQEGIGHEASVFIRIRVINLQEGIGHGASVFIRIGVINLQ